MNNIKLSICIPTFNREKNLENCLNSILIAKKKVDFSFEVCISDNGSLGNVDKIVKKYESELLIVFNKNQKNIGMSKNIIKSVSIASGKFVWLIGDDDLLIPNAFIKLKNIFEKNPDSDFFFINSYHLNNSILGKFPEPFDTEKLPDKMQSFSNFKIDFNGNFFDLIHPKISHDFLLGMFLSIFKKKKWDQNLNIIDLENLKDDLKFSNIDNTGPHIKIFSKAFSTSSIFFYSKPLTVNLHGIREWGDYYPLVESVWIPEIVEIHRKNGLSFFKYLICKNSSVKKLFINLFRIYFIKKYKGAEHLNFYSHFFKNLLFPSVYFFPIYRLFQITYSYLIR